METGNCDVECNLSHEEKGGEGALVSTIVKYYQLDSLKFCNHPRTAPVLELSQMGSKVQH